MLAALTKRFRPPPAHDGTPRHQDDIDFIIRYYRESKKADLKRFVLPFGAVLSTVCTGLGDTMMLTDLPKASAEQGMSHTCFSNSPHFRTVMRYNPHWKDSEDKPILINAPDLVRFRECGNGHYLQRIRRAFGLKVENVPKGSITLSQMRHRDRVMLHFDAGVHAEWQRKNIHPQARQITAKTQAMIEQFISERKDLHFWEVGQRPLGIKGARYMTTTGTGGLIETMAMGSWFIGIVSGPMHVATALNLKCVVITNIPDAEKIVIPCLKVNGELESEWLYPQNCHLHQDGDSQLVRQVSVQNLHRAIQGELYPYWSNEFAPLIHEKL